MTDRPLNLRDNSNLLTKIESRSPSASNYISGGTAEDILTGDIGEEEVDSCFQDIVTRVEKLVIDTALLRTAGLHHDFDANWDNLSNISDDIFTIPVHESLLHMKDQSLPFLLGLQIGQALITLTGRPLNNKKSSDFYIGFSFAYDLPKSASSSNPSADRSRLVNDNLSTGALAQKDKLMSESPDHSLMTDRLHQDTIEKLKRYGYDPDDPDIVRVVIKSDMVDNQLDRGELNDEVIRLIEEKCGEWFGLCIDMRLKLDEEWNTIDEAKAAGVKVKNALQALWEYPNNKVSSSKIGIKLGKETYKGRVSELFNQISIQRKNPNSSLNHTFEHDEPIVKYENGWKPTAYGSLLLHHAFDASLDPRWIQSIALDNATSVDTTTKQRKRFLADGLDQFYDDIDVLKYV